MRKWIPAQLATSICMVVLLSNGFAQIPPVNDDCNSAIHIPDISDFCSDIGAYSIVNATASPEDRPSCFPTATTDVWFTFFALTPSVFIQVNGNSGTMPGGTMGSPSMAVYRGTCGGTLDEVGCGSDASNSNTVERILSNLPIGDLYYIRVDARGGEVGTFQLCINAFISPPDPSADCPTAPVLCDKTPFIIQQLSGTGAISDEADDSCLDIDPSTGMDDGNSEKSSAWYVWTCDISGPLEFTLTPTSEDITEDLDFAVYRLNNGIGDCSSKELLRCMASGENVGAPFAEWQICTGGTGLRAGETDLVEERGCATGDNNFVAPIDMVSGESYALIVNNFSQTGRGFEIEFGGTGTFLGPTPDFDLEAVQAFECDKTIIYTNLSESSTDPIIEWTWNFGGGANPQVLQGPGPHNVVYASFGEKRAALTVETSRGCMVTKIVDLFVQPCCADTSTLNADANAEDLICPGIPTGILTGLGVNGAPPYQFSIDGMNFQPATTFPQLNPGIYKLHVEDSKGCRDSTEIVINDASSYTVDAGDTIFVELGDPIQLNAIPDPFVYSTITWTPGGSLIFGPDSLMPMAFTLDENSCIETRDKKICEYSVTVTNLAGCIASDNVIVIVEIVRPVYIPNVFSPNGDMINDYFYVQAGAAADALQILRVFDRWGALIFEGAGGLNDEQFGWDGTYRGQRVNPGVFTYHARVHFLDNISIDYSGTITVVR